MLSIAQSEEARFLTVKEFLDHAFGGAELASEDVIDRRLCVIHSHGDGDALSGGKPVGLDDDGSALCPHIGNRSRSLCEPAIGAGRNMELGAEILGETFRAFEPGGSLGGTEYLETCCLKIIRNARNQRRFRPHDDEADRMHATERDHRLMIADIEWHTCGMLGDARISGRAIKSAEQRACGNGPGERVLAPTGPDQKNIEWRHCGILVEVLWRDSTMAETLILRNRRKREPLHQKGRWCIEIGETHVQATFGQASPRRGGAGCADRRFLIFGCKCRPSVLLSLRA